jgi:PAS domain S-box-containing protein
MLMYVTANEDFLRNTIDSSMDMIQVFKAVRDDGGEIIDFIWILNNKASEKIYGDVVGKSLLTLNPGVIKEGIFDTFKRVVDTGEPDQSVRRYTHEQFDGWFLQSAVKQGDGVATTTKDITDLKKAEIELQHSKTLLQRIIDAPGIGIAVYKALRNEQGQIIDFVHEFMNQASKSMLGEDWTGRLFTEHGENALLQMKHFLDVMATGRSNKYMRETLFKGKQTWFAISNTFLDSDRLVHTWEDVSEQKHAEEQVKAARELVQTVFDVTINPIAYHKTIRDDAGRIIDFEFQLENQKARQYSQSDRIGRRHSEAYPGIRETVVFEKYCEVVETGESLDTEVSINLRGSNRWFHLMAAKLGDGLVASAIDITERKKAEAEILRLKDNIAKRAEDKYRTIFETMNDGFSQCKVLRDDAGKVVDMVYLEMNPAVERQAGINRKAFIGNRLSEVLTPSDLATWLPIHAKVADSGESLTAEYYAEFTNRWYESTEYLTGEDELSIFFRDFTERKNNEQRQQFLLEFSDSLRTENTEEAVALRALSLLAEHLRLDRCYIALYSLIEDKADILYQVGNENIPPLPDKIKLSDFPNALKITYAGTLIITDFENNTELSDTDRQSIGALGLRALVAATLRRGENQPLWCIVAVAASARNWTNSEVALIEEVSERTWEAIERLRGEHALKKSEEQFRRAIEEAPIPVIMHAEDGEVLQLSRTWTELTGFSLADISNFDLWLSTAYGEGAEVVRNHMHSLFVGEKNTINIDFPVSTRKGDLRYWSFSASSPGTLKDGRRFIVGMAVDITERKQHEAHLRNFSLLLEKQIKERTQELQESRDMLQTIYDTSLVGMSVFEPVRNAGGDIVDFKILSVNKKVERSSGRSDMVGKLYGELFPGIKQMGLFDLMVKTIETGEHGIMDYHYTYEGIDRWYSTMFVKGEDILVSTNMDITERILAEEKIKRMEQQQQLEIFRTSLITLEEERHRISESLHNGIAQLLYGIKINLSGLKYGIAADKFNHTKTYVNKLLTDAIVETRRISHELMPTTLEQFGLKSAIQDICEQLAGQIAFTCDIAIQQNRLAKYMELAIYRTVQELIVNVVKHAKATTCTVSIIFGTDKVAISVTDNGCGMPTVLAKVNGIGLASIRSKVELLDGSLTISSAEGKGTRVEVTIPHAHSNL